MTRTVKNDVNADPTNLDRKAARGVVSIQVQNYCPYHGKSSVLYTCLDRKWFRYSGVDTAKEKELSGGCRCIQQANIHLTLHERMHAHLIS